MNYKERLKQYLEEDVIYSEYRSGKCDMSDFDKFCIEHCKDIESLLNENQTLNDQVAYLRRDIDRRDAKINELEDERVPYTNEYVDKIKDVLNKAKLKLEEGIRFCENDSQGVFDKCNIAIEREQAVLDLLKEVE